MGNVNSVNNNKEGNFAEIPKAGDKSRISSSEISGLGKGRGGEEKVKLLK